MRTFIFLTALLFSVIVRSQDTLQEEPNTNENLQEITQDEENQKKLLKKMAVEKAIELQKELNLTNYTSIAVQKAIFKYSLQANKVIQSNMSETEKTKSLSNIIYFQNEELKKILTVTQFYQYLDLNKKAVRISGG